MQEDKGLDNIGSLLEGLKSDDVAPHWHPEVAWFQVEEKLRQDRKKTLPVWMYPLAAAALALCLLLLRSPVVEEQHDIARTLTASSIPAPLPIHITIPASPKMERTVAIGKVKEHVGRTLPRVPASLANEDAAVVAATTTLPAHPAVPDNSFPMANRTPEVIYTINEIMADIPEREEPVRKYSGFFRSRPVRENAEENTRGRRRVEAPVLETPHIITN
jgi:hypothetical protein